MRSRADDRHTWPALTGSWMFLVYSENTDKSSPTLSPRPAASLGETLSSAVPGRSNCFPREQLVSEMTQSVIATVEYL